MLLRVPWVGAEVLKASMWEVGGENWSGSWREEEGESLSVKAKPSSWWNVWRAGRAPDSLADPSEEKREEERRFFLSWMAGERGLRDDGSLSRVPVALSVAGANMAMDEGLRGEFIGVELRCAGAGAAMDGRRGEKGCAG